MRNYRHRNPKTGDEQKTTNTPFFKSPKGAGVQRKKEAGFLQRLATSKEDEKLGTHDARMEKDKEEPMKPVQMKQGADEKKKKGIHKMDDPEKKKKGVHKMDDPEKKKKGVHKMEDPEKKKKGVHKMDDPEKKKKGVHKKDDPEKEKKKVQKKEESTAGPHVEALLEEQAGKGSQLPKETLAEMSHTFGVDLSHVRIHTDAAAVALCSELNAQAFTHGCDIYFNEGKYNPESGEGKRLLVHELTHVVQQHA
jgi:hypothetical protein